ncbi:Rv1733c family protein [Amycolatopsis sp. NPDC004368]
MRRSGDWFARMWHALVPRHAVVVRPSDRFQAVVVAAFAVLALLAVPVAGVLGSDTAGRRAVEAAEQAASRHPVTAVQLADGPVQQAVGPDGVPAGPQPREVRWRLPGGGFRVEKVDVDPLTQAGDTVVVWLDRAGEPVPPPLDPRTASVEGAMMGFGAWAGFCAVLGLTYAALVFGLDRRRLRRWQQEWTSETDRRTRS